MISVNFPSEFSLVCLIQSISKSMSPGGNKRLRTRTRVDAPEHRFIDTTNAVHLTTHSIRAFYSKHLYIGNNKTKINKNTGGHYAVLMFLNLTRYHNLHENDWIWYFCKNRLDR